MNFLCLNVIAFSWNPCWADLSNYVAHNSTSNLALQNYDKIETGTFQLEVGVVPIWDLVRKTVNAFDIQARKRNVSLNFGMEAADNVISKDSTRENDIENPPKSPDFSVLNVVGDDMRLRQVILNLGKLLGRIGAELSYCLGDGYSCYLSISFPMLRLYPQLLPFPILGPLL